MVRSGGFKGGSRDFDLLFHAECASWKHSFAYLWRKWYNFGEFNSTEGPGGGGEAGGGHPKLGVATWKLKPS